jgi:hypothetical protein
MDLDGKLDAALRPVCLDQLCNAPADHAIGVFEYVRGCGPSGRIKWSRRPCTSADTPAA